MKNNEILKNVKDILKKNKQKLSIFAMAIISIVLAIITCSYLILLNYENTGEGIVTYVLKNINITKCAILILLYFGTMFLIYIKETKVFDFLYKFRYLIAGIVFILCVTFEISGSSIGMWKYCVGNDMPSSGDIIGKDRAIRGDEWVVFTPFAISQGSTDTDTYQYFSNTIRGDKTDVFIVYGQPVKDISMIFRPFQLGYLLFGSSRGLSFYWCGRFIALFLVTFELGMVITKNRKDLSFILAILTILSPAVQWWFSVNGLVEMMVFGSLAIIMLDKYIQTDNFWKRLLYLLIIVICGGGYILVFYPAWQVPMAYIYLGLSIWIIIKNWKDCKKIKVKDILSIIGIILIVLALLFRIYIKSKDTVNLVMNTAYPGARAETGGENWQKYFTYPSNLFFTLDDQDLGMNVCEAAVFFDLFPLGFVLAAVVIFKEKKKDPLLIILLVISAIFGIWCICGMPPILAKLSLLYLSPAKRTFVIVGFLNILILARAMTLFEGKISKKISIPIVVLSTLLALGISIKTFPQYYGIAKILISAIILVLLYYLILEYNSKLNKRLFISFLLIVLMFTSFLVNPVRKGFDAISKQPVGQAVNKIQKEESGLWIVEGMGYPMMNFPIMYGAPTINSTNTYPDLDRWKKLDPEGKYNEIYNRYAHIIVELVNNEETKFELIVQDSFKIYLPVNKLKDLDVKYIFTTNELETLENENVKFEKIYNDYGIKIYKIIN